MVETALVKSEDEAIFHLRRECEGRYKRREEGRVDG